MKLEKKEINYENSKSYEYYLDCCPDVIFYFTETCLGCYLDDELSNRKKIFSIEYSKFDETYIQLRYEKIKVFSVKVGDKEEKLENKGDILIFLLRFLYENNSCQFDENIINLLDNISASKIHIWGLIQYNKKLHEKCHVKEKSNSFSIDQGIYFDNTLQLIEILLNPKNNDLNEFPLFVNKDNEDLLVEIIKNADELREDKKGKFWRDKYIFNQVITFFISRFNFAQVFRIYKKQFPYIIYITSAIYSFWVHLLIVVIISLVWVKVNKSCGADLFVLYITIFAILSLIILPLSFLIMKLISKEKDEKGFYPSISLLSPKLTVSIIIGWLTILPFSNDLWQIISYIDSQSYFLLAFLIILFVVVATIIYNELKVVKNNISPMQAAKIIFELFFRGIPISLMFGVFLLAFSYPQVKYNGKIYPKRAMFVIAIDSLNEIDKKADLYSRKTDKIILKPLKKLLNNEEVEFKYDEINNDKKIEHLYQIIEPFLVCDSTQKCPNKFTISEKGTLMQYCINQIEDDYQSIIKNKEKLIDNLAMKEQNMSKFPFIVKTTGFINKICPYIFPPLLLLGSMVSFLIGFFIHFVLESKFLKSKV